MVSPLRGLSIVESEVAVLTMAMKRGQLWTRSSESLHPALLQPFLDLKRVLASAGDLDGLDPNVFLSPFLDVIRSEVVTGPVTGLALASVNKFLSYNLLHSGQGNIANAVENLADAVTHARFVGVDPSSDEIVLMKIMEVLRTLMLSPVGLLLTNESVCEIMQSTFRICFENRLSELLRKTAEHSLNEMIQLLFTRLPSFSEENLPLLKKLKMRSSHGDSGKSKKRHAKPKSKASKAPAGAAAATATPATQAAPASAPGATAPASTANTAPVEAKKDEEVDSKTATAAEAEGSNAPAQEEATGPVSIPMSPTEPQFNVDSDVLARSPLGSVSDLTNIQSDTESQGPESIPFRVDESAGEQTGAESDAPEANKEESKAAPQTEEEEKKDVAITVTSPKGTETAVENTPKKEEEKQSPPSPVPSAASGEGLEVSNVVSNGNKEPEEFTNPQGITFTPTTDMVDESGSLVPYGLPCVRELFRFLVSLINPHDSHNQDSMIQIALSLLATALETGSENLDKFDSLLALVKDDLARNLVSLLSAERIATFSSALWLSYLMFESQRRHLKYQLEIFLNKLNDVVCSESQKVTYEHKELALEIIVRFYRIPGFLTQLYLNFDCDMYTSNIFEDLTKMLSKNAFPVTGLYSTHFLSLDALLTVIESIESQCQRRIASSKEVEEVVGGKVELGSDVGEPGKAVSLASGHQIGLAVTKGPVLESPEQPEQVKVPTHEEVMALKHKKKLNTSATEQFNNKPSKGVSFMQECKLLKTPLDPAEIAQFMRQNPHLDKKQMGEYISNRKNLVILEAFVKSFDFAGLRVDESLRMFLEAFRLPGEAPLIQGILEHFADHWFKSNPGTMSDADSAFTLAYAVIMLNVDQHNKNHTKTNDPMTEDQFKRNLRGTNGGAEHDQDMLHEIFHAIRGEEIVMPAEQTGLVKENYLWKCVLRRGQEDGSELLMAKNGFFDHDLFSIIWGPTVAALSYVFDKSQDKDVIERAVHGFQRCAMIAAHYHMSDVFDNLIISLCKFTTLLTVNNETSFQFLPAFGSNDKALYATKMVFTLVQKHGDILRDGWKNITECLLQLFKCKLLPHSLMEAEDYIESTGRVQLFREEAPSTKVEPGFMASFMSFVSMSNENQIRTRTPEEDEFAKLAAKCVKECNLESLVTESKFLLADSLQELVKFLISGSHLDEVDDEHATLFYLELLVRVTIQNRDRVNIIWRQVSDHLARLIMSSTGPEKTFMLERSVTALLRLAVRLSRKEDLASTVVQSLQILLAVKVNVLFQVCRNIAFGLHELLRNNAANIHEARDWAIIFSLIEVVGAGANPNVAEASGDNAGNNGNARPSGEEGDSGHGASSESDATSNSRNTSPSRDRSESISSGGWIVLGSAGNQSPTKQGPIVPPQPNTSGLINFNKSSIIHGRPIVMHDAMSFLKCCESLAFLIRDVAHITPHNFGNCVQTLRTFVEASFVARHEPSSANGQQSGNGGSSKRGQNARSHMKRTPPGRAPPMRRVRSAPQNIDYDADESDNETDLTTEYHHVALQLLDLMHTLHTRAGQIHKSWAEESNTPVLEDANLWAISWCPLLQGMARLCCDKRSHIRTTALTTLQRALLYQDLQTLNSQEWENAFTAVLFPMLNQLLMKSNPGEKTAMEETRTRAATLLGKVFLQHLSPLTTLGTFTSLWLTILDFMQKFIQAASSDMLADAVPESLKNMLLVMDTMGIFFNPDGQTTTLWRLTWEKLQTFLPDLMKELFGKRESNAALAQQAVSGAPSAIPSVASAPVISEAAAGPEIAAPDVVAAAVPSNPEVPAPTVIPEPEVSSNQPPPVSPMDPPVMSASAFIYSSEEGGAAPPEQAPSGIGPPPPALPFNFVPPPPLPSSTVISSTSIGGAGGATTIPISIPSLPTIAPMPPPPVSLAPVSGPAPSHAPSTTGFQPIHPPQVPVAGGSVPVAAPKAIQLTSYFGGDGASAATPVQPGVAPSAVPGVAQPLAGNILTAAFTPTIGNPSSTVFLNSPSEQQPPQQ